MTSAAKTDKTDQPVSDFTLLDGIHFRNVGGQLQHAAVQRFRLRCGVPSDQRATHHRWSLDLLAGRTMLPVDCNAHVSSVSQSSSLRLL